MRPVAVVAERLVILAICPSLIVSLKCFFKIALNDLPGVFGDVRPLLTKPVGAVTDDVGHPA